MPEPITIAIYSSGSVQAQKLLFNYIQPLVSESTSKALDRRYLVKSWFDTTNAGPKVSSASYTTIAKSLGSDLERTLFLSDSVPEVEAALESGMKSCVVVRDGNKELTEEERQRFDIVGDLGSVSIGNN